MSQIRNVRISGTGMYVPPRVVTNEDLEKLMDTSDEWIRQRSGIEARRYVEAGVGTSDLALHATNEALSAAGLEAKDLDLIIVATLTPEHFFPGPSVLLQEKLGLATTPSMDVRCQCSGFIYALNVGQLFIAVGQYKRVLVVGAEAHSPMLDLTTKGRDVAVLFGDGAGAVILEEANLPEQGIVSVHLHSEGKFADKLWLERPGATGQTWLTKEDVAEGRIFPKMEGRFVFKHAVNRLQESVEEALAANNLVANDIDHFLFHQANLRINEHVAQVMGISSERLYSNIQKFGNCSAGSIPILLDECVKSGRIKRGDLICMSAFGSGFTWASALIRW